MNHNLSQFTSYVAKYKTCNLIVVPPLTTPGPLEGECPDPIGGIKWVEYGSHCYLFDTISTNIGLVEYSFGLLYISSVNKLSVIITP